eukprot:Tbor_TRINITY_DN5808_c0_g1::TRINITY_DN5808_c0_g1_i3::g.7398::m.7398
MTVLLSKCLTTSTLNSTSVNIHYRCRLPPPSPLVLTKHASSICLQYMPFPGTWCPLGVATVGQPQRGGLGSNVSAIAGTTPVCPLMTNGLLDGAVLILLGGCPCAPNRSQEGAKVAMNIIAPFSSLGPIAA